MSKENFKNLINSLTENKALSYEEAKFCFKYIMSGNTSDILISSFLTSLKTHFINYGFSSEVIAAAQSLVYAFAISSFSVR